MTVTLVHHDESVRGFVAKLAAAQGWPFDAYTDFAGAVSALAWPLRGDNGPPSARAPAGNPVTPVIPSTSRPGSAPPGAAGPHVLLAALRPPEGPCGFELIRRLAALDSLTRFVLLGESADAASGFSALCGGASALVLLPLNRDELLSAVRHAAAGAGFLPAGVQEASLNALCHPEAVPSCSGLTPTDLRVLWAMNQGRGQKGASQLLPMAANTVHTHASHINLKLGVHTLPEALVKAFGNYGCPYACAGRERERRGGKVKRKT